MAGAAKARVGKSMETCVQMMIKAAFERQQRNILAQHQVFQATLQAQRAMFLETMRKQREWDGEARSARKKENNRKLRALKSMMLRENGKRIDLTDFDSKIKFRIVYVILYLLMSLNVSY